MSKYDMLKKLGRELIGTPEIGGFVAIGDVSDNRSDTTLFLGLYDTEQQAQAAAERHGTQPLSKALDSVRDENGKIPADYEMEMGGAFLIYYGARAIPVTKKLATALQNGRAEWLKESPDWFDYNNVRIEGRAVASTYEEATPLGERVREKVRDVRRALSSVDLLKAAFSAAAAIVTRKGKGLAAFLAQAVKIKPAAKQATRPAAGRPRPARPRGPALRL